MTYDAFLLALALYREARGEGQRGMEAVACVVRNRVETWGGGYYRQLTGRNQFSAMSVVGDPQTVVWPAPSDRAWKMAQAIAGATLTGVLQDVTGGALFYENPAAATSAWFVRNVRNKRPKTATIGRHVFYA